MNKFDSFFDNLFPLRPLMPYVQSVLPTVFDDSLSYLETLGKVVKALNDTTSNVNTLEQAVRAFADDLAQYENLTITPVEITYNSNTGRYTASMTYSDIVSALGEGHTVIMHVSGAVSDTGIEFYSAALKMETVEGVNLLYWDSPVYTVDEKPVIYRAGINDAGVVGVTQEPLDDFAPIKKLLYNESTGNVVYYDGDTSTPVTGENVVLNFLSDPKIFVMLEGAVTTEGDTVYNQYVPLRYGYVNGADIGVQFYRVFNGKIEVVTLPANSSVAAKTTTPIGENFNSIKKLVYNESTGNVVYYDGDTSTPVTGENVVLNFLSDPKIFVMLEGAVTTEGDTVYNQYVPLRYGYVNGADIGVQFYRVFNGNIEVVTLPANSSVAAKTTTPIGGSAAGAVLYDTAQTLTDQQKAQARDNIGADSRPLFLNITQENGIFTVDKTAAEIRENLHNLALTFGLNEGVEINSYKVYGSPPMKAISFTVADPEANSVSYIEFVIQVYYEGLAPTTEDDVPIVTYNSITHNNSALPDTTNASVGDVLTLGSGKTPSWKAPDSGEEGEVTLLGNTPYTMMEDATVILRSPSETSYSAKTNTLAIADLINGTNHNTSVSENDGVIELNLLSTAPSGYYNSYLSFTIPGLVIGKTYNLVCNSDGITYDSAAHETRGVITLYDHAGGTSLWTSSYNNYTHEFTATEESVYLRWYPSASSGFTPGESVAKLKGIYLNEPGTTDLNPVFQVQGTFTGEVTLQNVPSGVTITSDPSCPVYQPVLLPDSEKPLYGKTVVCFGDSLFGLHRGATSAPAFIADLSGATVYNVGFGGCRMSDHPDNGYAAFSMWALAKAIAENDWTTQDAQASSGADYFPEQLTLLKSIDFSEVDYVVIHYGTNDYSSGVAFGEDSPATVHNTICGALRYSIETLLGAYPKLRIFVSLPVVRRWVVDGQYEFSNTHLNSNGKTLPECNTAMMAAAREYNCPVIDGYHGLGINQVNFTTFYEDNTHHNADGRERFGTYIGEKLICGGEY